MESHLSARANVALESFLSQCATLGVDTDAIREISVRTIKYLNGSKDQREPMRIAQELEREWYEALESGQPNWEIYGSDYYLAEMWACWRVYSRKYLRDLASDRSGIATDIFDIRGRVDRVVDLGCGIGYSTAALKEIYPDAEVIGTNLAGTTQTALAEMMGRSHGFRVEHYIQNISGAVDLVFASEYFEHFPKPVDHLNEVLFMLKPATLLIANAFGTKAIGHFDRYSVNGSALDGKAASRRFNKVLRDSGYEKVKTTLWNGRPAFWRRLDG